MLTCGELVELFYTFINKVLYFILSPLKMVLNSEFLQSEYDKLDVQHKYDLMVLQKTKFKNKYLKLKRKTKNLKKRSMEKTDIDTEKYNLMVLQKIKFKNKYLEKNRKVKVLKSKLDKLRQVLQTTDNNLAITISQFDELQDTYLSDYQLDNNITLELLYKMKYNEKLNDQEIDDLNEKLIDREIKENEKVEQEKLNERMRKWYYENLEKTDNRNVEI